LNRSIRRNRTKMANGTKSELILRRHLNQRTLSIGKMREMKIRPQETISNLQPEICVLLAKEASVMPRAGHGRREILPLAMVMLSRSLTKRADISRVAVDMKNRRVIDTEKGATMDRIIVIETTRIMIKTKKKTYIIKKWTHS